MESFIGEVVRRTNPVFNLQLELRREREYEYYPSRHLGQSKQVLHWWRVVVQY